MSSDSTPDFKAFTHWMASGTSAPKAQGHSWNALLAAARTARDEVLLATQSSADLSALANRQNIELLQVLAAATQDAVSLPPELATPKGYRVVLARDAGTDVASSSIAVLVHAPLDEISWVQGKTAFIWKGEKRFELGQFDADGKAYGCMPVDVEVTLADLTEGVIRLEEFGPALES